MEDLLTINPQMPSSPGKNITSVVSRFGKRLLGFIRQRVDNEADAEDILQEVWYQLTRKADIESIEQVSGWLFAVARNKIIDNYRRRRPESVNAIFGDNDDPSAADLGSILLDDNGDPEAAELRSLFWKTLQEGLDELPEQQRLVFVWNELEGIPFKEIADLTGEKQATLISRKHYAVLYLREKLLTLYHEITNH